MGYENIPWPLIWQATRETLIMLGASLALSVPIGLVVGVLVFLTSPGQFWQQIWVHRLLSLIVNVTRSVPFIIMLIYVMPLTRWLVGTSIGVKGAIPPLVIAAAPFFARLTEIALREVDRGVIEAAEAMGTPRLTIIRRVLLREARTGLIAGITVTAVNLVSYTAMSGVVGGGGLGDLAIRYGYQRFRPDVMAVTVLLLVILVQLLQSFGDRLVRRLSRNQ
ncbi:MAG: metal ABC transporter permease [Thermobacillus sp. ZCTH02-B1]|uniref:methionine ABC transporter permease n=1 Tax=Thermobacillus sp. ZCTH02-B1 TaxID=1858795 RepID=UPI000B55CDED|nr:methionine ABC transporter permease [Thermobacillus sp. ZCTH02-B1]OUM94042.1 MAG: metal ABC transporter permease [Thermobacillus sp. ZCTH02-B1]